MIFFHVLIFISSISFVDEFGSSQLSTELNSLNSSGMPTPSSGTRPGSQTNSYSGQLSVASGMSVVDDRKLDEILGDGLQNQVSLSKIKVKFLVFSISVKVLLRQFLSSNMSAKFLHRVCSQTTLTRFCQLLTTYPLTS